MLVAAAVFATLAVPGVAENAWSVRGLMFLIGLVLGTAVLTVQISGFASIAPSDMGRAMGLFQIVRTLGGAVGIAACAAVIGGGHVTEAADPSPYRTAVWVTAALVAAGALIALRLPREAPQPPPFEDEDTPPPGEDPAAAEAPVVKG